MPRCNQSLNPNFVGSNFFCVRGGVKWPSNKNIVAFQKQNSSLFIFSTLQPFNVSFINHHHLVRTSIILNSPDRGILPPQPHAGTLKSSSTTADKVPSFIRSFRKTYLLTRFLPVLSYLLFSPFYFLSSCRLI